jgi:hypothetical protein
MSAEIIFGIITICLTLLGLIMKSVGEMRIAIQQEAVFHTRTEEKLNMVNFRLGEIEKNTAKFEATVDDLQRYMANNSDWHTRKNSGN